MQTTKLTFIADETPDESVAAVGETFGEAALHLIDQLVTVYTHACLDDGRLLTALGELQSNPVGETHEYDFSCPEDGFTIRIQHLTTSHENISQTP